MVGVGGTGLTFDVFLSSGVEISCIEPARTALRRVTLLLLLRRMLDTREARRLVRGAKSESENRNTDKVLWDSFTRQEIKQTFHSNHRSSWQKKNKDHF